MTTNEEVFVTGARWQERMDRNLSICGDHHNQKNNVRSPYKYDWEKPPAQCCDELVEEDQGGEVKEKEKPKQRL